MTLDEDVDQTVLAQGADQTIESHGREMADGRTPCQTEPAMSGQQGIAGRFGSHRAVAQDEMGQHGQHGLTVRALHAPDGETAKPHADIMGVTGQTPAAVTGRLVGELKAQGEDEGQDKLDKRLTISNELKVGGFILEIDGKGTVCPWCFGGLSQVSPSVKMAIGADET